MSFVLLYCQNEDNDFAMLGDSNAASIQVSLAFVILVGITSCFFSVLIMHIECVARSVAIYAQKFSPE